MKLLTSIYRDALAKDLRGSVGRANGYNLQQILYNNSGIFGNLHKFENFLNVFGSAPVSSEFVSFIVFWKVIYITYLTLVIENDSNIYINSNLGIETVLNGKHFSVSLARPEVVYKCCFVDDEYVNSLRFFRDELLKTDTSFSKTELLESIRRAQKNSNLYDFWSKVFDNSVKMFDSEVVSVSDISTMLFGFLVKKYSDDAYLVSENEPATSFSTDYDHISPGNSSNTPNTTSETLTNSPNSDETNPLSDSVVFTAEHFESTWSNLDTSNTSNYASINTMNNVNNTNNIVKDKVVESCEPDETWDYEYKYRKLLSDLESCLPRFYTYYSEAKCELTTSKEEIRRLLELNEELNDNLTKEKNTFIDKNSLLNSEIQSVAQQNEHLKDLIMEKDKEIETLKKQLEEVTVNFDSSDYGKVTKELQIYIAKSEGLIKSNDVLKAKIFNLQSELSQLQNMSNTNTDNKYTEDTKETDNTTDAVVDNEINEIDEIDKNLNSTVQNDEIIKLSNQITQLTDELIQLRDKLTQSNIEISELRERNSTLEGDNLRLKELNEKLESEIKNEASLRNDNLFLTNTNNELRNTISDLNNTNNGLIHSNSELTHNLELLKRENRLIEAEFDKVKSENARLASELEEMSGRIESLTAKNNSQEDFSNEYKKAKLDIMELETRLEELTRKNNYLVEIYEQVSSENLKLVSKLEILNNPSPTYAKNKLVDLVKNYQKYDDLQSPLSCESESTDCDHSPNCSTASGEGSTNTLTNNFHSDTLSSHTINNYQQPNLKPTVENDVKDNEKNIKNERIKICSELASVRKMNTMTALKNGLVKPNSENRTENSNAQISKKIVQRRTDGFKRTISMNKNLIDNSFRNAQSPINYDKLSLNKSDEFSFRYDELGIEEQQEPNIIKNTFSFIYKKLNLPH
ncbi:uncharacterized protein TA19145 [Theileria annulata]|uniref:Uncharacterized protein n=1 Tax=Theileria annulata TaxID=5874 RepID=Q4UGA6_THEAN|nr:uncharacterized protein TA19145 [Theileria annulata]CAI73883.1 hypothetical protein TA19145 [Theileria annulata]|eukprot:XP_954560.1 hypothetical protein TA19145 [Theileria annulata]